MTHLNIISKGKVFPTESLNAQGGMGESKTRFGIYSDVDPKNLPEKTAGELISENNKVRKEKITRNEAEKDNWQHARKAQVRSISDDFSDSLKKYLK